MGSPCTEMDRETRIFPYGESLFPNRVCIDLGINICCRVYLLPYRPGDKRQLMFQDVSAKYCIYDKVPLKMMSFFDVVKGCVNFHEMTSVHKKRVFAR